MSPFHTNGTLGQWNLRVLTGDYVFRRNHHKSSSSCLPQRWNFRTREPQCVNLWFSLSGAIINSLSSCLPHSQNSRTRQPTRVNLWFLFFQAQSPQVVVVMSPPQMELSDKRAKILCGLGATHVTIGILEILFNIGASIMWAHVAHFTGAGYWCGVFVSHGFLLSSSIFTTASKLGNNFCFSLSLPLSLQSIKGACPVANTERLS